MKRGSSHSGVRIGDRSDGNDDFVEAGGEPSRRVGIAGVCSAGYCGLEVDNVSNDEY